MPSIPDFSKINSNHEPKYNKSDTSEEDRDTFYSGESNEEPPIRPEEKLQKEVEEEQLKDYKHYLEQRRKYIQRLYLLLLLWIIILFLLVSISGAERPFQTAATCNTECDPEQNNWKLFANWIFSFTVPSSVLIALAGGATANVLGLFFVVVKYLYPDKRAPHAKDFQEQNSR